MRNVLRVNKYANFLLSAAILLTSASSSHGQTVHILFDATKGEMAGNADWVIDADATTLGVGSSGEYSTTSGHESNPQRVPTPAQSGITSSTSETYWTGAISGWAVDCAKKGYAVESLPFGGQITYGNTSNAQDLSNYEIFVVDEPNLLFTTAEKTAIINYVQNGGRLFIVADHDGSDRNGDGYDSRYIWNDLFTNNSVAVNPFGINFDAADFTQASTNISASTTDSIIHGPMGTVSQVYWAGGTTMTLDPSKNSSIKGVVFKTGTTPGNSNAMVAYGRYGLGKFAAMGDSSPTDDGTGDPGDVPNLYNGYFGDAAGNHQLLIMNMTIWLADKNSTTEVSSTATGDAHVTAYPNPTTGTINLSADHDLTNAVISVYNVMGKEVYRNTWQQLGKGEQTAVTLDKGYYFIKVMSDQLVQTSSVTVY